MTNIKKLNEKLEQFLEEDNLTSKLQEIFTKDVCSKIDPKYELGEVYFYCQRANERFVGIYKLKDLTASVLLYTCINSDGSFSIKREGYKDDDYNEKEYFVYLKPQKITVTQDEVLDEVPQFIMDAFDQVLDKRYNDVIKAVSSKYNIPKEGLEIAPKRKSRTNVYVRDVNDGTLFVVDNKSGKVRIGSNVYRG